MFINVYVNNQEELNKWFMSMLLCYALEGMNSEFAVVKKKEFNIGY